MEKDSNTGKRNIAFSSVLAAVFLTVFKLIVGLMTGSLGILSEALHSGLDLIAALVTLIAVRISDKPADEDHNFGHGKIENYSALIETLLLFITCIWIIYEAVRRLTTNEIHIDITVWSFVVVITSIVVDISRSRALMKAAKKYHSQALEADAIHFSTDIWSSSVVLIGLVTAALFNYYSADAFAAIMVAVIVLTVSFRLGKRSFDALIDKAPTGISEKVSDILKNINGIRYYHDLKVRESGADKFIEVNIHVDKNLDIVSAHDISDEIEKAVAAEIINSKVTIHIEPDL